MVITEKILYEYAKVLKEVIGSGEPSEQAKKNVTETLDKLISPDNFYMGENLKCYNGLIGWYLEARAFSETGIENCVPSLDRAIDCYNYYNKGVEI